MTEGDFSVIVSLRHKEQLITDAPAQRSGRRTEVENMKMTSAVANKMVRKLMDDKAYYRSLEEEGSVYVASLDEDPVIPEYNYSEVAAKLDEINEKIVKIKHAINLSNCTNSVTVGEETMTIDMVLVKMAQLNARKSVLDGMRKQQPKTRVDSYYSRKASPEYRYVNYDLNLIKSEYEKVESLITEIQIALDYYNQTVEFEVEI